MKKPSGTISATALREKMRVTEAEIQKLEKQVGELMQHHDELKIRHAAFAELLRELRPSENGKVATLKITDVILDHVRSNPGIRSTAVVDHALELVKTTAKDPRKNIHQTILNLKNRGWLESDGQGGLRVVVVTRNTNGHGA